MIISMDDLKDGARHLQCTNTGRCANDDHNGMKYEETLLTFLMNQDKKRVTFQSVIDTKIKSLCEKYKVGKWDCSIPPEMEPELKEFTSKAVAAVVKYISMQCADVDLNLK